MSSPLDVPAHLRRFVVEQDYEQYNAADQAVWRFVLLQTRSRLLESAHPVYREGLAATGISVERIPDIRRMNEALGRFGWGAVCVDGFIEPRAFQEFQAANLLPIAAEIRRSDHLVYTPAPDIIHEAAGHAPILPEPVFAAYVRRMGELGRKAFTLPEEARVYRAIHALSQLKEDPIASTPLLQQAERELALAIELSPPASEAAQLSRLYWWTAEYGLIGDVQNYKLYGAGLLSSLWESHACHAPNVQKLPLDERCLSLPYDITRPQPVLFVTQSFERLHELLDAVEKNLAATCGGTLALERARASAELASARFSSGAWVLGVLSAYDESRGEQPAWLEFTGSVALAWHGQLQALPDAGRVEEQVVLLGPLAGGTPLERCGEAELARRRRGSRYEFEFESGARVSGCLPRRSPRDSEDARRFELSDVRLDLPGLPPRYLARYALLPAGRLVSIEAGAVDARYHPESARAPRRVPKPRSWSVIERQLLELFERAAAAHADGSDAMTRVFPEVQAALDHGFPREWLLRWNLLESLEKVGVAAELQQRLRQRLEQLEVEHEYLQPIASGLRYLATRTLEKP